MDARFPSDPQAEDYEDWFSREVDAGLAAANRGEFVEHDEIRRRIEDRHRE